MKRGQLKRKTGMKRGTKPLKRTAFRTRPKKLKGDYPQWFKDTKLGSHGSNAVQKKTWSVISEYVRRMDFHKYGGKCVSCDTVLTDWRQGDCGHFKAWTNCNGLFKFHPLNLALQCKACNGPRASSDKGFQFGMELKRRYGASVIDRIDELNARHHNTKLEDAEVFGYAEHYHSLMPEDTFWI